MADYSGYKKQRAYSLAALASVYEATAPDGRPGKFALKIFHPPPSTNVRRQLSIEGWLLAAERQKASAKAGGAVLEILACGRCEEGAYMVTPWQERRMEPLVQVLHVKGDNLRALAECLLNTLEQWEAQTGGPHGKLKPGNVFFTRSGPLPGMTAQFSDPWHLPGASVESLRQRDLAAVGGILAQIVRRRAAAGWPIEDAPEWKALHGAGKGWLAFCNFLLNPHPEAGTFTLAEARKHLKRVPRDARPVRTAVLTGSGVLVAFAIAVTAYARFGDPEYMPVEQLKKFAETVRNPRAYKEEVTPDWGKLCHAWDSWLITLQNNGGRLENTTALWAPNDPLKASIASFLAAANDLRPGALVPEAANEKRMGVLGVSPPVAVRQELVKITVDAKVREAWRKVNNLALQLEKWQRWDELRTLLKLIEARGFTRAADALAPRLAPLPGSPGYKQDVERTLKLFNDISLDETGTLLLAKSWSEVTHLTVEMETSGDRIQQAMPTVILGRLVDRSSLGDFADSLADPLAELKLHRKQFNEPDVVRDRFLKESGLQTETAEVTAADFPRWEQELVLFSKVPKAEDPRLGTELDASLTKLRVSANDLEKDAPTPEPGGLATLSQSEFEGELKKADTSLVALRAPAIVRRDLPKVAGDVTQLAGVLRLLEQRLDATLALLRPEIWLNRVQQAVGKLEATRARWAAWQQAALAGVTARSLEGAANRPKFRSLRDQARQVRDWLDAFEGPDGFGGLAIPGLAGVSADTAAPLLRLEAARREQAAKDVTAAAEWQGALPAAPWSAVGPNARAPLEAHREWLSVLPAFAADFDRLAALLTEGFGWTEGISEVFDRLAKFVGLDAIAGRPAESTAEARQLARLVDTYDRPALTAAAQSGGLSRKLMAWRRLGAIPGWPAGPEEFDIDGTVAEVMRKGIASAIKDEARRSALLRELASQTRARWNRAALGAARNEKQLATMFDRMKTYSIAEEDLDPHVAYNLALFRLKRDDWSESNLDRLRIRRDKFVEKAGAIREAAEQHNVREFIKKLNEIKLIDDPNRPPTPSPRLIKGWQEELSDGGLGVTAIWNRAGKTARLEFILIQPQPPDETLPFYLAKRTIAVGEFVDMVMAQPDGAGREVLDALPQWTTKAEAMTRPWNKPVAWRPKSDYKGIELNSGWIYAPTAAVLGLMDNKELRASTPVLEQALSDKPTPRTALQMIPPDAARIYTEKVVGARLPKLQEWRSVVKMFGSTPKGNFRGPSFQGLYRYLESYREAGQTIPWRPGEGAFLPMVPVPGGPGRRLMVDDGQAGTEPDNGRVWVSTVDDGPTVDGFVNLFGNVWIYLYDDAKKEYYVAGGSALAPPTIDRVEPQKVEAAGMVGARRVTEGFSDVGIRPAFDAPPGFRERYQLLLLVRGQSFLTI